MPSPVLQVAIKEAYQAAHASGRYDTSCYMMANECEYWAEGTQAWFDATVREGEVCSCLAPGPNHGWYLSVFAWTSWSSNLADVTSGMNTREKLRERDSKLAELMTLVYGEGKWRYPATAPRPFASYDSSQEKRQRAQRAVSSSTSKQPTVPVLAVSASGEVEDAAQKGSLGASVGRRSRRREKSPAAQRSRRAGAPGSKLSAVSRRVTRAFLQVAGCCLRPG